MRGGTILVLAAFLFCASGCSRYARAPRLVPASPQQCEDLKSRLQESGMSEVHEIRGKVTIDANQYRVRGTFGLTRDELGNVTLEFTSTTLIGGHVEDIVVSLFEDTLRVLDRERGAYHEGEEVDELIGAEAGIAVRATEMLRRLMVETPDCERVLDVSMGNDLIQGRLDQAPFEIKFSDGLVSSARWGSPFPDGEDRLEVSYRWERGRLTAITAFMPEARWRVKLIEDD